MTEPPYSKSDLELFVDLDRAARASGVQPCLIGAGAIQLGGDLVWRLRIARRTLDWDFAVQMESWEQFDGLASALTSHGGGFQSTRAAQRFGHHGGGQLDVVPFGDLEDPHGTLRWPNGVVMNTSGLRALDRHHLDPQLPGVSIRAATMPAIVGLKLLAYIDRRPRAIYRDIEDVYSLLLEAENVECDERVMEECMGRFDSGDLVYSEASAYLLGRDVGKTFKDGDLEPIVTLLEAVDDVSSPVIGDILRGRIADSSLRDSVLRRFRAFHFGILDR